jgi:DNA-directed RNA polymerase subunit K/omega
MIYPTFSELTKDQFNRYQLAVATAKCARIITDEYVKQRETAEKAMTGNKDTDKPLMTMIDKELKDEKAVKIAINRIHGGEYSIVEVDTLYTKEEPVAEEAEAEEAEAVATEE